MSTVLVKPSRPEPLRRSPRRIVVIVGWVVGVCWIGLLCAFIAREPPPGASSAQALASAAAEAVSTGDAQQLQRLLGGQAADGYAQRLIDKVGLGAGVQVQGRLVQGAGDPQVVLSAASAAVCLPWNTVQEDGRWLLDAVPTVGSAACSA
ncbi:hypothetical protein [Kineococcus arenarius]|uniref:hypothetical protein n=1 Tax=unclassified Kineococcus TaxID=2621656 RepID=UPI003D7DFF7E